MMGCTVPSRIESSAPTGIPRPGAQTRLNESCDLDEERQGWRLKVAPSGRKSRILQADQREAGRQAKTRIKPGNADVLPLTRVSRPGP